MIKKFRAWIEEEKKFIYPTKITFSDSVCYVYDSEVDYEYQINPDDLHQWTTLLDKNKKEIYEGDVIRDTTTDSVWTIQWDLEDSGWCDKEKYGNYHLVKSLEHCLEVIGNNKENPGLL